MYNKINWIAVLLITLGLNAQQRIDGKLQYEKFKKSQQNNT